MLGPLSFASPLLLAALLALPAIWLLLRATPPEPRRVRFPAFVILKRLESGEETPDRTPLPLLLLRLLLAAAAIIGLAGPILNAPPPAPGAGPIVFVLDDSWGAAANWRDRQEAIKAGAAEAQASGRQLFLIRTARPSTNDAISALAPEAARGLADSMKPVSWRADRKAAEPDIERLAAALGQDAGRAEVRWLSDGLGGADDDDFAGALAALGEVSLYADRARAKPALRALAPAPAGRQYRAERLDASEAWAGEAAAFAADGRELARVALEMAPGESAAAFSIDLPLALRNSVASVALAGVASAGAVQLNDARDRRSLIGLLAGAESAGDALLAGAHYVRKALDPYAEFLSGSIEELIAAEASVIILDDVGRLRPGDVETLGAFIDKGGVVVRFAGPNLADAALDGEPPLLPILLRGGGRAFGGALTWETPQTIGGFAPDGPFADLALPQDVLVRQQVLAAPGGETGARTWASLADGTPIVTGVRRGAGALALFHVAATPSWSDLPLSLAFVEMLRQLTYLSALGPKARGGDEARLAPIRVLDGFGRFDGPAADAPAVAPADAAKGSAAARPAGFYGAPEAPIAVNALASDAPFVPLSVDGLQASAYEAEAPVRIAPYLFAIALMALAGDAIATLIFSGKLRWTAAVFAIAFALTPDALRAEPPDRPIDGKTEAGALRTRLAYVRTGDPDIDRLSERGLAALTRELIRRTAVEPDAPAAVDPETDDLSVYPLLYWPIAPGDVPPSERGLAHIELFMRFGGLIVFDTRDDERAVAGAETPERAALRAILSGIDTPPLTPIPRDHVLHRSFYLLDDLEGRTRINPVFVQAGGRANDGVTPLIIGGRDWASAWATDEIGRPLRPVSRRGGCGDDESVQECAWRAGINIVMVAYTGNYKSDQVHAPILLERLGR
jgi:hypothetical protein